MRGAGEWQLGGGGGHLLYLPHRNRPCPRPAAISAALCATAYVAHNARRCRLAEVCRTFRSLFDAQAFAGRPLRLNLNSLSWRLLDRKGRPAVSRDGGRQCAGLRMWSL